MTREQWLTDLAARLETSLFAGRTLPPYRIGCGFPSRSGLAKRNRRIGECWSSNASADKTTEIIVSLTQADAMTVAGVLAHEMVHAVVGLECGHKGPFKQLAKQIGLEGKMTQTNVGEAFKRTVQPILDDIGPYPHAALDSSTRAKQSTRLLKAECGTCGYTVRVTQKWLDEAGAPHCPLHDEMHV